MGLVERHISTADLTCWRGRIPVQYVYTAGRAGEAFFQGIIKGKLVAAKCHACDTVYLPPRIYCESCFARLEDCVIDVMPEGRVHTFTLCRKMLDGSRTDAPLIIAMIKIDHTDGGLVHYLSEVSPKDVSIGMLVEAVFKPKRQRKGSILDIAYFKPKR